MLFPSAFASVHSAKSLTPTCVPPHGSNVVGNTIRHGDMLHAEMLQCYTVNHHLCRADSTEFAPG